MKGAAAQELQILPHSGAARGRRGRGGLLEDALSRAPHQVDRFPGRVIELLLVGSANDELWPRHGNAGTAVRREALLIP